MNKNKFKFVSFLFKIALIIFFLAFGFLAIIRGAGVYFDEFREKVSIQEKNNIELIDPIVLNFSVPILSGDYAKGITIYPSVEFDIKSDQSKRKIVITPRTAWNPESEYVVTLPEGYSAMFTRINIQQFRFTTERYPKIREVSPVDGAKDVLLGAEDPLIIDFDKSTKNFYVDFQINPVSEVVYQNNSEKTQFRILPKEKVKDGTLYAIEISIRGENESDEKYQKIYSGKFETLAPAPASWEKDYALRIDQAKKFTRPKVETGRYIDINLDSQIMTLFEDGKLLDSYLVSSGKRGMDTPIGEHKIYNKHPRAFSKKYGLFMPYWMAILPDGKVGLHELPEWPGGYKEGQNHLGIPVSHGCVRMGVGAAKRVYEFAEIGTPVIIY